jgi:hypothetical protein
MSPSSTIAISPFASLMAKSRSMIVIVPPVQIGEAEAISRSICLGT